MGAPRISFSATDPRIFGFVSSSKYQLALAEADKREEELFRLCVGASVSMATAQKLKDLKDIKEDISTEVTLSPAPYASSNYPRNGIIDTTVSPRPMKEIIDIMIDQTGMPELFKEFTVYWKGRVIPNNEFISVEHEELQSEDFLFQLEKARGYRTREFENILGLKMFKPRVVRYEIENALKTPVSGKRMRSIEETKWIVGSRLGFRELPLQLLQEALCRNKFYEDVGIHHKIASGLLNSMIPYRGGAIYSLWKRTEDSERPVLVPLWHEEYP